MSEKFISYDDKITCLEREINMRKYVYPRRVSENKMSQNKADAEIEIMKSVLKDIQKLAGRTPL